MKKVLSVLTAALMAMALFSGCSQKPVEYVVLEDALSDEEYAIAFRKEDKTLRDEVQRLLCEMKKDGKLAEITTTWFGKDTSVVPDSFEPKAGEADDSLQKIKDAGVFKLGLDDSLPPMGFQDKDGTIIGYDIDLAREVCNRIGVKLETVPINWTRNIDELNAGNIDCIWNGLTVNAERDEKTCLTEPYLENQQVVVTLKDSGINKLDDLKGKRVALQAGSTAVEALDGKPDVKNSLAEVSEIDNNVLAMYELRQKTSDAVVMDETVARYYIGHLNELEDTVSKAD
mgnify:CR=1 FL=1